MYIYIHTQNKWCTEQLLTTHQCPACPWAVASLLAKFLPFFKVSARCYMEWSIPLASLGQLSCFCPIPTLCAPSVTFICRTVQETEKMKCPWLCTALLSNKWNVGVLSTLFFSWSQSMVSYHTIWRKNGLSPSWNKDTAHDSMIRVPMLVVVLSHQEVSASSERS